MRVGLTTAIATAIAIGVLVAAGGAPGTANIWIDTSGGTCADSASLITYPDNGTECGSLNDAVQAAEAGDTIGWRTGTYSAAQEVANKAALNNLSPACDPNGTWGSVSTSNCVRVVPDGGTVTVNHHVVIMASSIWIDGTATGTITSPESRTYNISVHSGISAESESAGSQPDHVILDGISACCFTVSGGKNVHAMNMAVGGRVSDSGCVWEDYSGVAYASAWESRFNSRNSFNLNNMLIEYVYFHDVNRNTGGEASDCHDGALQMWQGNNVTFRKNVWAKNWVYDMDVDEFADDMVIENNWFGCGVEAFADESVYGQSYSAPPYPTPICNGQAAIQFNTGTNDNWLIRYNSSVVKLGGCLNSGACDYSNIRFVGNATERPDPGTADPMCPGAGVTHEYNVYVGGTCGANDSTDAGVDTMLTTITPGSEDFHLEAGSNGNNKVSPTSSDYALTVDIDGQSRPIDSNRDAGSDER